METVFLLPCQTRENKIQMQYFSFFQKYHVNVTTPNRITIMYFPIYIIMMVE